MNSNPVGDEISIESLLYRWPRSNFELSIDSLVIPAGRSVAIVGPSGSGKTTLLNLVAGVLVPQSGLVMVGRDRVSSMHDAARRRFRIQKIGFVFQQFDLIPYLSAWENVRLPYLVNPAARPPTDLSDRIKSLLDQTGLAGHRDKLPSRMSQGEQQRLALCRALITRPSVVLADEPTGNLDGPNKERILELLFETTSHAGLTLAVVTHDTKMLDRFDEVIDFANFLPAESRR